MSSANKFQTEKNQRMLLELANQPGNDTCADCKARAPRWASHNLGIFICVNCASIHRKIGTHISKVKSITLDSWTKEQVENVKQNGNAKSNALYNPDERRHPPPTNMSDSERDSELEKYIRNKYEFKTYMQTPPASASFGRFPPLNSSKTSDRSAAVAALLGPSRSAASLPSRQQTKDAPATPTLSSTLPNPAALASTSVSRATPAVAQTSALPSTITRNPLRSVSQPVATPTQVQSQPQQSGVWGDMQLIQQQPATINATLPLQVASFTSTTVAAQPMAIPNASSTPSFLTTPSSNAFSHLSASPGGTFPASMNQSSSVGRSVSLGSGLTSTSTGVPFGSSSYQSNLQAFQPSLSPMIPAQSFTPSPNPFSPQPLPAGSMSTGTNGMTPSPQPPFVPSASPYGQPTFTPQSSQPQHFQQQSSQPQQMFAPQPTGQFTPQSMGQFTPSMNPYGQAQPVGPGTPFMTATPQPYIGGTPSPFGQSLPAQQAPMQQGYAMAGPGVNANTNPFTSWIQQPPQQQQWGR